MSKYIERRTISAYSLRKLCVRNEWFTRGTNEEYERLFKLCSCGNITVDILGQMADMIEKHSELPADVHVEDIMFDLNAVANVTFQCVARRGDD